MSTDNHNPNAQTGEAVALAVESVQPAEASAPVEVPTIEAEATAPVIAPTPTEEVVAVDEGENEDFDFGAILEAHEKEHSAEVTERSALGRAGCSSWESDLHRFELRRSRR